jgi:hypothetical protein
LLLLLQSQQYFYLFFYKLWYIEHIFFLFLFKNLNNSIFTIKIFSDYNNIKYYNLYNNQLNKTYILNKNVFFLKFYFLWSKNFINKNKKIKLESENFTIKIGVHIDNVFDCVWIKIFNFCNKFLFEFFLTNKKLLILDSDYKNHFFFLLNNFNICNLSNDNHFFFPFLKNFTKKDWLFYFTQFCYKKKIMAFFVNDLVIINRNITVIAEMNIPIISFLLHRNESVIFVSYHFFFAIQSNLYLYILAGTFLNYTYFLSYNYRLMFFKILYITIFTKCINSLIFY